MRLSSKIPATVITGFLGAGKTTLIRHLIENAHGRRIALIVNEFGDVGIDGDLLKACGNEACGEEDIVELANGCICCTVAEDFIPTMEKLLTRDHPPEHIVIETSGLALPQPLVRAFNWPEIKTRVTVDGVVTLADAEALAAGRFASDEAAVDARRRNDDMLDHETPLGELFEDQVSCADLIVLTKTDLVEETDTEAIETRIAAEARAGVRIIRADHGTLPVNIVLGLDAAAEDDGRQSHHETDTGLHDHSHDGFDSFAVTLPSIDDMAAFRRRLDTAIGTHGILRLKGFAEVSGKPMRLVVQAVGPRLDTYFDRPWQEGEARRTSLVIIGAAGLDRNAITAALAPA